MSDTGPRLEITVAAPVDTVWAALRDRGTIRHWHGWDYGELDAEIEEIYFTDVTADTATHTLVVQGGDTFRLDPAGADATRVTLVRAPRGDDPEWDAYYDDITEGWITFLHQLRFAVERQPGTSRRTILHTGRLRGAEHPAAALGLSGTSGTPVRVPLAGEEVTGEVWFRSEHQVGITVDSWGPGLLIVSGIEPTPQRPAGAATAVLSTYGLPDARVDELAEWWSAWWTRRYPAEEPSADAPAD